jgi:Mn-dependent DtxR family transcriptional regulator
MFLTGFVNRRYQEILEWQRENDGDETPKQVPDGGLISVSRAQVSRRLKKLEEHDLVRHIRNYVIRDEGEGHLLYPSYRL